MSCVSWCDFSGTIPEKTDTNSRLSTWEVVLSTFSNWFRNEILGILRGETPTIPTTLYVAAHSTACTAAAPGTELDGDGYARTAITFERVSDIKLWNASQTSLPMATANWTVASFSLWDSPTRGVGNYYAFGNLASATTVEQNKAVTFQENKVIVGMGTPFG